MSSKNLLAASVALALGMSVAGNARADAVAQASLAVTNFLLQIGGAQADISQLGANPLFQDSASLSATINGVSQGNGNASNSGAPLPQITACAGGTCPSPFVQAVLPPVGAVTTTAISGSSLDGTPITGLPYALGASAVTAALASVTGNDKSGAQSGLTLNSSIKFTAASNASFGLSFNVAQILQAWDNSPLGGTATNSLNFKLQSVGANNVLTTLFSWSPSGFSGSQGGLSFTSANGCNINTSATVGVPSPQLDQQSCNDSYTMTYNQLIAGTNYVFSIGQQSIVSVQNFSPVPEPSSVALVGLALAGLGFAGLRRKQA